MLKTLLPVCALSLLSLIQPIPEMRIPGQGATGQPVASFEGEPRSMASIMPADSILYLEAPGLGRVLGAGLEHPLIENLLQSELGLALLEEDGISLEAKLKFVDAMFGEPVLPALAQMTRHGVALSVGLRHGQPATLVGMYGESAEQTTQTLKRIFKLLEPKGFNARPARFEQAKLWSLEDGAVLVQREALVLFASTEELAREALKLAEETSLGGLAGNRAFAESMARDEQTGTLRAWVNSRALAEADPKQYEWMDQLQHTPTGQLLLGAGLCGLLGGEALALDLDLSSGDLELELWSHATQWPVELGLQHADKRFRAPARLDLDNSLAEALVYRDIETFLAERPALLRPRDLPGVSEALSTISLFFGGMDYGEEISPDVSPWIQLISTELEYTAGPTPSVQYPALALVAELRNPERSGQRWNTAFQSLIGMLNIDAAQKKGGRGSMLLGLSLEGDTVISHASYPTPAADEPVDARYNLRPACCVVEGRLVIGSHEDLVRSIVRKLKSNEIRPTGKTSSFESLTLRAAPLDRLVADNFEALVMDKVVDEGLSFEKASEDVKGMGLVLRLLEQLDLRVDYSQPESMRASLRLSLQSKGDQE